MTPTNYYSSELDRLGETLTAAQKSDIAVFKEAIVASSQQNIIAIGSGGSFTTATFMASLHEAFTGRVSRAATPLELICNPTIASTSPIFIVSAEGKNPDVLEALRRARRSSSRNIHVLTNRASTPLCELADSLSDVSTHIFPLSDKDGYLATNSLLMDAALVARAYGELSGDGQALPSEIGSFRVGGKGISDLLPDIQTFAAKVAARKALIVVFSPNLRPVAVDLESKLAESALAHCQLADFRSFAHGRHLWLAEKPGETALLVLTEPGTQGLWDDMREMIPSSLPTFALTLDGSKPRDLIAGLIAQLHLVGGIAEAAKRDIAKPEVWELGRQLYYADLPALIPPQDDPEMLTGETSKYEALGSYWPSPKNSGQLRRALLQYKKTIDTQSFRSIVFDYDGTISSSNSLRLPPSKAIIEKFIYLLENGIYIGIASGRGASVHEYLREALPEKFWDKVYLGLYNGGWTGLLGAPVLIPEETSEFLLHCKRLIEGLKRLGVPIREGGVRITAPYQVSVRFDGGASTKEMWYVIADALRQAGLTGVTLVRSKHSVDVLASGVSKANLISEMVRHAQIDPFDILTVGDLGAWPGNDYSLLEHRFSLSVDLPSRRLDRGWKLAPLHIRDVDATLWYLERAEIKESGHFQLSLQ